MCRKAGLRRESVGSKSRHQVCLVETQALLLRPDNAGTRNLVEKEEEEPLKPVDGAQQSEDHSVSMKQSIF